MIFSLWQFCLLSLLLSFGVIELQASHHVYSNLQTTQLTSTHPQAKDPYRTGYHFQPRKNWINGMCIFNLPWIFSLLFSFSAFSSASFTRLCLGLLFIQLLTVCSLLLVFHIWLVMTVEMDILASLVSHRSKWLVTFSLPELYFLQLSIFCLVHYIFWAWCLGFHFQWK